MTAPVDLGEITGARVEKRRRQDVQRLARRFLLAAVHIDCPSGLAAAVVRADSELHFLASPRLDEVDLKLAAVGCAMRSSQLSAEGDDSDGVAYATLAELRQTCAVAPRGLNRFVDEVLLGLAAG